MAFGKREQIIVGCVSGLALMAILHFAIFAPTAQSFNDAKRMRDETAGKVQAMRIVNDSKVLDSYQKETDELLTALDTGMKRLRLDEDEAFILPKPEDVKVERQPGDTDEQFNARKKNAQEAQNKEKENKQAELLLAETAKLLTLAGNPNDPSQPQTSFMGQAGWRMPSALPDNLAGPALWQQLAPVADIKFALDRMNENSPDYKRYLASYNQQLRLLGLDVQNANRLKSYGEFVPLYYRLAFAQLILDRLKAEQGPVMIAGAPLDHDALFKVLDIELPGKKIEGLDESKVYFAYEGLRNLNQLIEQGKKLGVLDVTSVVLRGYGFLRELPDLGRPDLKIVDPRTLASDEADDPNVANEAVQDAMKKGGAAGPGGMMGFGFGGYSMNMMNQNNGKSDGKSGGSPTMAAPGGMMGFPGMGMGGGRGGASAEEIAKTATKPRDKELGYVLPIKITFRASYPNTMNYVYEVLRDKPLAEIHRFILRSLSSSPRDVTNPNMEATTTFLFVPKLFNTLDTVRQVLKEVQEGKTQPTSDTAQTKLEQAPQ